MTDGRKENASRVLNNEKLDFAFAAEGKDLSLYKTAVDVMNCFYTLGPFISTAAIHDNTLYVGSADGFVYAINLEANE